MSESVQKREQETCREAVGVFHDYGSLEDAVSELSEAGFTKDDISLLADETTIESKLGKTYEKVTDLADDKDAPRAAYISSKQIGDTESNLIGTLFYAGALVGGAAVVTSGGAIAAAIAAALASGAGGQLLGALLSAYISSSHAHYIEDQLKKGGILIWVRVSNSEEEEKASEILKKHSADDVHIHELPAPCPCP